MADKITRTDVVGVAVELLAEGGLHALAMRRIAAELGVQQSALYWHVENKQQLLAAVADEILAPIVSPEDGDWPERITTLATRLRAQLLAYPDGAELVTTVVAFRLGGRRPLELFVEELQRAGLVIDEAEIAAAVLIHFVLGYTTDEQQHRQAAEIGAIEHPAGDGASPVTPGRFERGVQLIIAGIAAGTSPRAR